MKRSRKILITAHCILNANAKVHPLAEVAGVTSQAVDPYIQNGTGLVQLPCPELTYLGLERWGMTREQYDQPNFRDHCRRILESPMMEIKAFVRAGYELTGVMGMDGSPNCGVNTTCIGYRGGELCDPETVAEQTKNLRFIDGQGVFMEELLTLLHQHGLYPKLFAVREKNPL